MALPDAGDVTLVDEAGMVGTPALGRLLTLADSSGAVVRLLGDPMQLSAVEAGGALRLLAHSSSAAELDRVHRFTDPAEAAATLGLRRGRPSAIGFYRTHDRISDGSRETMLDEVYDGWRADLTARRTALMVSASTAEVAALSARARRDRVAGGQVEADLILLRDGNLAGVGDLVVTRQNQRVLTVHGGRDFVKNGDLWQVMGRHPDGGLTVRHQAHAGAVRLRARFRPPWLPPPPSLPPPTADPIAVWAVGQDRLVTDRVEALVGRVATEPPSWASGIPARPEPGPARDRWERDVGVVAAYRDQHRIPDDVDPWAATSTAARTTEGESAARTAWRRLHHDPGASREAPTSVNDRLRALIPRVTPHGDGDGEQLRASDRRRAEEPPRPVQVERGPRL